jgi:hypothetical protein
MSFLRYQASQGWGEKNIWDETPLAAAEEKRKRNTN